LIRYSLPYHPEDCQGKEQLQLEVVLADSSIEDLPESKLTFDDDPKGIIRFVAEVGFAVSNRSRSLPSVSLDVT
jgi:hypothetical protein